MKSFIFAVMFVAAARVAIAQTPPLRLTVADAIAAGFDHSHRLAEARAREEAARAAAKTAGLARMPVVGATAGYMRTNHVEEFFVPQPNGTRLVVYPDIPDNFTSRLSLQWPIYTAGRIDALERAAAAEVDAAAAEIETARADLRLEIVRAYWAAVTSREAVRVLEESLTRANAQVTDAKRRFEVGLIPPNEVLSLEAQLSRERAHLIEASNIREAALIDLRRLIGAPPDAVVELADSLEDAGAGRSMPAESDVRGLVADVLKARPERKALSFRLAAAEAREKAARTTTKPTIAVAGGVDYANPNPRIFPRQGKWQESWDVGVFLHWNFLDFGRARSQAAEAAAIANGTRARIADVEAMVAADLRQRLLDVESTQAAVTAATDAVRSAAEARRVVADRFAAGVATSTDVLVAQVALLETQLARTRALANVRLAEARLERAMGR